MSKLCYTDLIHILEVFRAMAEEIKSGVHSSAQKIQRPLWKEVDTMTESELKATLIDNYMNLQRIISASDVKKEAEYQIKGVKAKLESMGIVTEDLDIH